MPVLLFMLKWWKPLTAIAAVGIIFWVGWSNGSSHATGVCEAEKERARIQRQASADRAAAMIEGALSSLRNKNRTLLEQVEDERAKNSMYHNCVLPDGGVHLLRDAARGTTR